MKNVISGILLVAIAYVAAILWLPSDGGRADFSPDLLVTRSRSRIAFEGIAPSFLRLAYEVHQNELVAFLVRKGYWSPNSTPTPRWLPTVDWTSGSRDGESMLQRTLFWKREFWIDWTERRPEKAAELWPKVLRELRQGREVEAVQLLEEAKSWDESWH